MNQFSQKLTRAAISRGYSTSNPVLLTTDSEGVRVNVVVSAVEPHNVRAPLNLIWIQPESGLVRKRVSRESSEDLQQTWTETFNFWEAQVWDEPKPTDQAYQELNRNVGNPHNLEASDIDAMGLEGGTFTGPVRTTKDADFNTDEFVPLSFIQKLLLPVQSLTISVWQQMSAIRSQMTGLNRRVILLEAVTENIAGIQAATFDLETDEEHLFTFNHGLDAETLLVNVVNAAGTEVLFDKLEILGRNEARLKFAGYVKGTVSVIRIR